MIGAYKAIVFLWLYVTALMMSRTEGGGKSIALGPLYDKQNPFDNDFEEGTMAPWVDLSEGGTSWVITTISSSNSRINGWNAIQLPSPPPTGRYFLSMKQDLKTFDIGILSSTNFNAFPGDTIQFSFWISSSWSHFPNLQLFWSVSGQRQDERLIELFPTSTSANTAEWRIFSVLIPVSSPTEGRVMFYGFGSPYDNSGLVAIDDIKFIQRPSSISSTKFVSSFGPITSYTTNNNLLLTEEKTTNNFKPPGFTRDQTTLDIAASSFMTTVKLPGTTANDNNKCFADPEIPEDFDFSPCSCYPYEDHVDEPYVTCNQVNMTEVRDRVFRRLDRIFIGFLELVLLNGDGIPPFFLQSAARRINYLFIDCIYLDSSLIVDELSFKALDNITTEIDNLEFRNCNLSRLEFMSEIKRVYSLELENSSNIYEFFSSLPTEFVINILHVTKSKNLNLIDAVEKLPKVVTGLLQFRVDDNKKLMDTTVDLLLEWLLSTEIRDTLDLLSLFTNDLKTIPKQIWRFNNLQTLTFDNNILSNSVLKKGELKFSFVPLDINLNSCGIEIIEPGAFQGDLSGAWISLKNNKLTRFESDVFLSILEQMIPIYAQIYLIGNPFDCESDPCHLAWLIRDHRNFLYVSITGAFCKDGRSFESIKPDDPMFKECP